MRHPNRLPIFPANAPSKPAMIEVLHRRPWSHPIECPFEPVERREQIRIKNLVSGSRRKL